MDISIDEFNKYLKASATKIYVIIDDNTLIGLFDVHNSIHKKLKNIIIDEDKRVASDSTKKIVGFYYPSRNAAVDDKYKKPDFGNFYASDIYVNLCGHDYKFNNVESVFQAFKLFQSINKNGFDKNGTITQFSAYQSLTAESSF